MLQSAKANLPAPVKIGRLVLTDYRGYSRAQLSVDPDSPLIVLTGPNGAGKTNVLEAISYLAPGRGLRGSGLGDITRAGTSNGWAVSAQLDIEGEAIKVGTGFGQVAGNGSRRLVKLDGETQSTSNCLGERWTVSWLTPQMDRLFIEGPSSRRRFLDRLVIGLFPDHSRQIGAYERVMRDRNKLLSEQGLRADTAWLSALEVKMAEHAVAIAVARLEYASQLAGKLADNSDGAGSHFPKAGLALDGELEQMLQEGMPPVEVEAAYKDTLKAVRAVDAGAGRSSRGVHKSDLLVTHLGKSMPAEFCSTGEQKALLIALTLANARLVADLRGHSPVLLLDEIVAHLDDKRRAALFDALKDIGGQCWLTGTDTVLFDAIKQDAQFFKVCDGTIHPSQ
ncbi:DNA replication and repair protein RecF [Kordiimonas sediminis]|uniref:DNA replication and repair protein RecF n=1 Tax=Kordiimonas sediminis TaxID=1735581 RepID=A0A919AJM4_9PROT|nr:DNA replication/repair protein RecF [Kordiimonas sediminis]GHF12867.1 DNA replication and repair protein RecF [Kordiimonas sediminis]